MDGIFSPLIFGIFKYASFLYAGERNPLPGRHEVPYAMLLPATDPYKNVTNTRKQKEKQIEEEFYSSDAMVNREWTRSNQPQRRAIIGLATHGFHHKMCKNSKYIYHQPSDLCECKICEQKCERYHFKQCKRWTGSLNDLIKDK